MGYKLKFLFLIFLCHPIYAQDLSQDGGNRELQFKQLSLFNRSVPQSQFTSELAESRIHHLKHHKKMGHITMGLMTATVISAIWGGMEMKDKRDKRQGRYHQSDLNKMNPHFVLGGISLVSYFATSYFALSAPKFDEFEDESRRVWHKNLAYIHFPAMVLAPVLGFLAAKDIHDGKEPHGLAKLHRPLMYVGYLSFVGSYLSMTLNF